MSRARSFLVVILLVILGAVVAFTRLLPRQVPKNAAPMQFDGQRAMKDVQSQMAFGPRTPGSAAHDQIVQWIQTQAKDAGWQVEVQQTTRMGHPIQNIIAKRGSGKPWIILGAHYDSRMRADQDSDPTKRLQPVPGANDGASGVAVLLELARVLPADLNKQVWLAFIDAEDQGDLPGWDWILGSRVLAESLNSKPDAVVIIDMIGDADLNIYMERNSDQGLTREIWNQAAQAGYGKQFIPQIKYDMLDDHTPFLQNGMRAVDLIDFDYPYWHTSADTADKLSAKSLEAVGETLRRWLLEG
jgi:glutaminyl-peptide cyclotransferase